jgi:predicted DCC family thiol-disulfide oxidoreductase YuxK
MVKLSPQFSNFLSSLGFYLRSKAFPGDSDQEHFKFSLLRILFGLLLFSRCLDIHLLLATEPTSLITLISLVYVLATLLLAIGMFTQWVLVFLVFFMWQMGETILSASTLGNDIAAMLAVMLFLCNSGKYLSVDAKILANYPKLAGLLLYTQGNVTPNTVALIKLAALSAYWAVCVYSMFMHINEPAWVSGVAGPLLLSNNFMSSWHEQFAALFSFSESAVHLARYSMWGMMLWYPAVLPFVLLGGVWRSYIIIWGLLFFTLSMVVLQLGTLAEIEFILWAAIFWSKTGLNNSDKIQVFYDDKCNLCDKTVRAICYLDIFSKVELKPVSENHDALEELGIDPAAALTDLYGACDSGRTLASGYSFYMLLVKKLVLLWPIYPLLLAGKIFGVGNYIYSRIALKRVEWFGVCVLPSNKHSYQKNIARNSAGLVQKTVSVHILLLSAIYLVSMPVPWWVFMQDSNSQYTGIQGARVSGSQAAHLYGITPINVFNATDLRMAENWFTLRSEEFDELLPVLNAKGERLDYHKSDRIYFGGTVPIRRSLIRQKVCAIQHGFYQPKLLQLIKIYLKQKAAPAGSYTFHYRQYFQQLPDAKNLVVGIYRENKVEISCELTFSVDNQS